jgi:beta-phosphoglucomutase-like phosphatase (HAD superfamily)
MIRRPVEAVIFDMDGLLIDTERVLFETMVEVAPDFGVVVDRPLFQSLIGLPIGPSSAILVETFGPEFRLDDFLAAVRVKVRAVNAAGVCLKAGVVELLDLLDVLSLPRAVCTSSARENAEHHLGQHGLVERFDAIIARGDYVQGKPHPEPFLAAAARLGVEPQACLALEDSHNGVRAAHAAGMQVVMVPDMLDATDEMRGLCVHVADTLHDAARLLRPSATGRR